MHCRTQQCRCGTRNRTQSHAIRQARGVLLESTHTRICLQPFLACLKRPPWLTRLNPNSLAVSSYVSASRMRGAEKKHPIRTWTKIKDPSVGFVAAGHGDEEPFACPPP